MKKIQLLCLVFLLALGSLMLKGQDNYVPFPTSDAVWSVNSVKFGVFGDTVICGKAYAKVYRQKEETTFEFDIDNATYYGAIRNDVDNKKVYFVYLNQASVYELIDNTWTETYESTDSTEFLIYDFSLQLGETANIASFFYAEGTFFPLVNDAIYMLPAVRIPETTIHFGFNNYQHYYDSDSMMTLEDGSVRKRLLMRIPILQESAEDQLWIEGIGSSFGPFSTSSAQVLFDIELYRLLCFEMNNTQVYEESRYENDSFVDCFSIGYGAAIPENLSIGSMVNIYPNPTNDIIHFELEQADQGTVTIQVFNMLGQLVTTVSEEVTANENRHFEVSLKAQPDGIYYYKVENGTKRVNGKIVKL